MIEGKVFIDSKWISGRGDVFSWVNPATLEPVYQGMECDEKQIDKAVQASLRALLTWSGLALDKRILYLNNFKNEIAKNRQNLAERISMETGKPLWESLTEVKAMEAKVDITILSKQDRQKEADGDPSKPVRSATRYKPHGPVAVLGPFNFPGHLPNGHILPALLAGNTVIFKPSEKTPGTGQLYTELWEKAGLPSGVFQLVQGALRPATALVEHPGIRGIFFTGSYNAGKAIHNACSGYPDKILALEMGGNNPLVVHEVEDLDAAAYMTIQSAFITAGQRCVCARRLILIRGEEANLFLSKLSQWMGKLEIGPYTKSPEPFMGPVINQESTANLIEAQEQLLLQGGRTLVPMKPSPACHNLLSPGLIDVSDIKSREDGEFFGPLLQLIFVDSFAEAITEANNTRFGLAAALLSDDKKHFENFYNNIHAGIINWNRPTTGASSAAPFGGVGLSGNHRPSAYFAIDYCAYPIASQESDTLSLPAELSPGFNAG